MCLGGIADYFSASITTEKENIDIIIYCSLNSASKYLFRTSPHKPIEGVFYQTRNGYIKKWDELSPPIPPFTKLPFKQRFTGLHASAVKLNNKTYLFIGAKGSGKTTISMKLSNDFKASFLTDETVFIINRSTLVEPFPRMILPRVKKNGEITKKKVLARDGVEKILDNQTPIDFIYFLNKLPYDGISYTQKLSKTKGIKLLLENYLYAGSDLNEAISTLIQIAKNIPMYQFNYSSYNDLMEFTNEINYKKLEET